MFMMADYVRELTSKKSCYYGKYELLVHLLVLFAFVFAFLNFVWFIFGLGWWGGVVCVYVFYETGFGL